ncbi:hypothetical protein D9757_007048 [Collybiopsis confluens]|uniref:Uncharacterized protein n=1 Tax=Collybiopsis confluens TaxID=2823264 RepID=A0A8H5M4Q6_9AGAR|nr:hypothetical protein D9757_007048 [Collybiopsis confluens]
MFFADIIHVTALHSHRTQRILRMHERQRKSRLVQIGELGLPTSRVRPFTSFDQGFLYSTKLNAHSSCINALVLSKASARFLASGGDDLRIQLWDFHQEDVVAPCHTFVGPRVSGILAPRSGRWLECGDRIIYFAWNSPVQTTTSSREFQQLFPSCSTDGWARGGTDDIVHKYDVSRLESGSLAPSEQLPNAMFREDDTIRDLSGHAYRDELFISASESGRIVQHDTRVNHAANRTARASDTIQLLAEVTSAKFHPSAEHLFVSSDSKSNVCLRDVRMAFGPSLARTNNGIVRTFHTAISKRSTKSLSIPEPSSVSFNSDGKYSIRDLWTY